MSDEAKFTARLTRGESYYLTDFHFPKGVDIVVTETTKIYLEETAIDEVAGPQDPDSGLVEKIDKAKFDFKEYSGDAPVGAVIREAEPAPRRIRREA